MQRPMAPELAPRLHDLGAASANAGDLRDLSAVRKIPWRRAWQPAPVCLPTAAHGQRRLEGYSP